MIRLLSSETDISCALALRRVAFLVVMGVLFLAASLRAQDEIRINVGIAAAKPGDAIDIPLTFSAGENATAGSIVAHVAYPKATLEYTEMERGLAVELADGEVKVTSADDPADAAQAVLEFAATGKSCIKPGILGYLKFKVSSQAQKSVVDLKLKDSKATGCQGAADVQLAKGDDGQLTIFAIDEEIPVIGCFFFTH
jgi:hypothetical protein